MPDKKANKKSKDPVRVNFRLPLEEREKFNSACKASGTGGQKVLSQFAEAVIARLVPMGRDGVLIDWNTIRRIQAENGATHAAEENTKSRRSTEGPADPLPVPISDDKVFHLGGDNGNESDSFSPAERKILSAIENIRGDLEQLRQKPEDASGGNRRSGPRKGRPGGNK